MTLTRRARSCALLLASTAAHAAPIHAYTPPVVELGVADIRTAILEDGASCTAIVQAHLERIAAYDGALHSIIALDPDAMRAARALDALPQKDKATLPLLCVPVLVKDSIDVAGMASTGGSRALVDNVATRPHAAPGSTATRR
jgi:Asp-tRNA(Asn)/Glu-tRNA(Gln) amidotransferase A subunit family amidase